MHLTLLSPPPLFLLDIYKVIMQVFINFSICLKLRISKKLPIFGTQRKTAFMRICVKYLFWWYKFVHVLFAYDGFQNTNWLQLKSRENCLVFGWSLVVFEAITDLNMEFCYHLHDTHIQIHCVVTRLSSTLKEFWGRPLYLTVGRIQNSGISPIQRWYIFLIHFWYIFGPSVSRQVFFNTLHGLRSRPSAPFLSLPHWRYSHFPLNISIHRSTFIFFTGRYTHL